VPVDPKSVKVRNLFKIFIYPHPSHFKKQEGLPLAHRLSKLVCEGRRESQGQKGAVRGGWGLAGQEFGRGGGLAFDLASVQALNAGFDQRTVSVGKTVGKKEKETRKPLFS